MNRFAQVLQVTRGWTAPEAADAAAHAQALAEKSDNLAQLVLQMWGSFNTVLIRGDLPAASAFADQMLDLADARDLLAPLYSSFTEGFDTPDLKDAKALLDGLTT